MAGIAATVTAWILLMLGNLRFDYDFEAFFPNEKEELDVYNHFRETFGHDNEFVLIAPVSTRGIFRKDFLLKTDALTQKIAALPNVQQVQSPSTLKRLVPGLFFPVAVPVLHIHDPARYASDSTAIYNDAFFVGSFFPEDAKSVTVMVQTSNGLSKTECDTLAAGISRTIASCGFEDVHVAGRIFAQQVYLEQITREFVMFICIAFVLVVVFLWCTFRTAAGVLLPLTVVLTGIVWTLGLMHLTGKPVDLLTTMLPTMIFITGMSDVVHFFSRHAEITAAGLPPSRIYPLILREVGVPTFVTLVTTVVTFLSLLFSSIRPVREFGVYTAIGIAIAFVLTYTLLPSLILLVKPRHLVRPSTSKKFESLMRGAMMIIFHHRRMILGISAALVLVSVAGLSRIRVNNILLEDLSEETRLKQDFAFFDLHYSGVRPFELLVRTGGDEDIWSYRTLRTIARVDSFVRATYDPGFLVSPAFLAGAVHAAVTGERQADFSDPESYRAIAPLLRERNGDRDFARIVRADGKEARISGKIRDMGSIRVNALNTRLMDFIAGLPGAGQLQFTITGAGHLMDRNNAYMVENMTQGFVFSVVMIALLTFVLHKSWRMVLVFLLPNLIPLLVIAGIMGWAGIELKAATSIIFSIAFGIATDDTIHFISRLKIERGYGKSLMYAFKRTYLETGKPIVLTTFILLGGFMSMMTSDFQSTFYFGFLTCITILVALLADLFLLPVMLFLVYRKIKLT